MKIEIIMNMLRVKSYSLIINSLIIEINQKKIENFLYTKVYNYYCVIHVYEVDINY